MDLDGSVSADRRSSNADRSEEAPVEHYIEVAGAFEDIRVAGERRTALGDHWNRAAYSAHSPSDVGDRAYEVRGGMTWVSDAAREKVNSSANRWELVRHR